MGQNCVLGQMIRSAAVLVSESGRRFDSPAPVVGTTAELD
jgi:hypothetical protein